MIISFSVFKEKIENGEKCQTIRKYNETQYRRFCNCWEKRETTGRYNLFWRNPRNGGTRIKDAIPSEDRPFLITFVGGDHPPHIRIFGYSLYDNNPDYLNDIAKRDGFSSSGEMWDWFEKTHGKGMYQNKFMIIRWLP